MGLALVEDGQRAGRIPGRQQAQRQVPPDVGGEQVLDAPSFDRALQQLQRSRGVIGGLVDVSQRVPGPQIVGIEAQSQAAQLIGLAVASDLLQGEGVLTGHEPPSRLVPPRLDGTRAGGQTAVGVPDVQIDVVREAHRREVPLAQGDVVPGPGRIGELPGDEEAERSNMALLPIRRPACPDPSAPCVSSQGRRVARGSGQYAIDRREHRPHDEGLIGSARLRHHGYRVGAVVQVLLPAARPGLDAGRLALDRTEFRQARHAHGP